MLETWKLLPIIMHILVAYGNPAEEELHLKEFFAWLSAPTVGHLKMDIIAWLITVQTESLATVLESVRLLLEWLVCVLQAAGDLGLKTHCSHAYIWICIPPATVTSIWIAKSKVKESVMWGALWLELPSYENHSSAVISPTEPIPILFSFIRLESFLPG